MCIFLKSGKGDIPQHIAPQPAVGEEGVWSRRARRTQCVDIKAVWGRVETKRRTRTGDRRGVWMGVRASLGVRVDLRIWACGVSVGVAGCSETNCRAVPGRRRPASPCAMTRMSKEGGRFERRTSGHAHVTFQDNNAAQSGTRLGTATASCYSAPARVPGKLGVTGWHLSYKT